MVRTRVDVWLREQGLHRFGGVAQTYGSLAVQGGSGGQDFFVFGNAWHCKSEGMLKKLDLSHFSWAPAAEC